MTNIFVFSGLLIFSSCVQKPATNVIAEEALTVWGPVSNYAVLNGDTVYEGGWDTGMKSIEVNGDTVVFDCSHLFHGYYWRWCGDSLFNLDTNVVLIEVNKTISFLDTNFWCLDSFSLIAERTDSSFYLESRFNKGDTVFYQKSYWGLKDYWPID